MDTNKTQNLELLLDATDFPKFLTMEDFKHYELHKAVGPKYDWILTSNGKGVIYILIDWKSPGTLLHKIDAGVQPQFSKGYSVRQKS